MRIAIRCNVPSCCHRCHCAPVLAVYKTTGGHGRHHESTPWLFWYNKVSGLPAPFWGEPGNSAQILSPCSPLPLTEHAHTAPLLCWPIKTLVSVCRALLLCAPSARWTTMARQAGPTGVEVVSWHHGGQSDCSLNPRTLLLMIQREREIYRRLVGRGCRVIRFHQVALVQELKQHDKIL